MAKFIELTPNGETFVKREEGVIPYVYDDAVYPTKRYKAGTKVRGNLTAGVGHLLSRGNNIFPEAHQWIGKDIPHPVINQWFDADTDEAESTVHRLTKTKLLHNERDAMISFTFNTGVGAYAGSTLLKKLNAGDKAAVPGELQKWTKTKINGKKITSKGLQKRRANEIALWLGGRENLVTAPKNVVIKKVPPSGTQIAEAETKHISIVEGLSAGGSVVMGAAGFAQSTGVIAWGFLIFIVAVVVIGGAIVIKRYFLDNKSAPDPVA